jgi:hypothetical protein
MLHRLIATSIVAFWLAMTSMLVVRELYPESAGLNAVAVSYVGQLFFQHQQSSDLKVHASGEDIGFVHVQARPPGESDKRELEFNGNLSIPLPNGTHQRLGWFGRFRLTSRFNLERFDLTISADVPGQHVGISVDCFAKTAEFTVKAGNRVVDSATISLDERGFASLISQVGFDPKLLEQFQSADAPLPHFEFHSQLSSIILSGEKISTYLLTMKAGGQPVFEAHVSQLGQILKARVPLLGYKLASSKETQ